MRRYLFGPVSAAYADQNLLATRHRKECLTFGWSGTDIVLRPDDTYETLVARLPSGWRPDFLALYLAYSTIPEGLWAAPVPVVTWHRTGTCSGTSIGTVCRAATPS